MKQEDIAPIIADKQHVTNRIIRIMEKYAFLGKLKVKNKKINLN